MNAPLFGLGRVVATAAVMEQLQPTSGELAALLTAHAHGEWGDVGTEDKRANDAAVKNGSRLLSSYRLRGRKLWVITDMETDACAACNAGLGTCEPDKGEWHDGLHFRTDLPMQRLSTTVMFPEDY